MPCGGLALSLYEYQTSGWVIGGPCRRPVFQRDVFAGPCAGSLQVYCSPNVSCMLKSNRYMGRFGP